MQTGEVIQESLKIPIHLIIEKAVSPCLTDSIRDEWLATDDTGRSGVPSPYS